MNLDYYNVYCIAMSRFFIKLFDFDLNVSFAIKYVRLERAEILSLNKNAIMPLNNIKLSFLI
jgi:hypothetical protein